MNKEKFDYLWKITLLIVLTIAILYMFYEWNKIDKEALACQISPFDYGQAKAKEQGINCYYSCFTSDYNRINEKVNLSDIP